MMITRIILSGANLKPFGCRAMLNPRILARIPCVAGADTVHEILVSDDTYSGNHGYAPTTPVQGES